jgi:hypothetical protein
LLPSGESATLSSSPKSERTCGFGYTKLIEIANVLPPSVVT